MKLFKILKGLSYEILQGDIDKEISGIKFDSRKIENKDLFICIKGYEVDGHKYVDNAIDNGATVIICEDRLEQLNKETTYIKVDNTRKTMADIAVNYYDNPTEELNVVGVTGTNGKTTITYLISSILNEAMKKNGVIGTIENKIGDRVVKTSRTTPEAIELQALFQEMKKEGVRDVVMEVSSHALELHRVDHINFKIGIFTNLTLDHLDFHQTMENYMMAKAKLFKMCKIGVFNVDDEYAEPLMNEATCEKYTYGIHKNADFKAKNIKLTSDGVDFILSYKNQNVQINLAIPGEFSIYNALAAAASVYLMGIPLNMIQSGLNSVKNVKGRFEKISSQKGFSVIVDYAHAPDGLLNVLKTIKGYAKGEIITVFGCGGDRDKSKRPQMGKIAGEYSDYCIITSDNPRTEEPESIIDSIEPAVKETGVQYSRISDRKEAIETALNKAKKDAVVLIAGKGHETYQEIGKQRIHFDDMEIVRNYLEENK